MGTCCCARASSARALRCLLRQRKTVVVHSGDRGVVPSAWQVAFAAADNEEISAAGNLLLGVNAHVARDLPFVLEALGFGEKADHDKVNDILYEAYPRAMAEIDRRFADSIDSTNVRGTTLDDDVLFEIVVTL